MSVIKKIDSIESLVGNSLSNVINLSNFNFQTLQEAITELLDTINYQQTNTVSVDISRVSSDYVIVRTGLSVLGSQQNEEDNEVIRLLPSGSMFGKNAILSDVIEGRRLRLRIYGELPSVGVPGEIAYIRAYNNLEEGFYGYLVSTGWTLLSGSGQSTSSISRACRKYITRHIVASTISGDGQLISNYLVPFPAPIVTSEFLFFINGQQLLIGNGTLTAPLYFSKDNGVSPSIYEEVDSSDNLYWNSSIAGYDLDSNDMITLIYATHDLTCASPGIICESNIAEVGATSVSLELSNINILFDSPTSENIGIFICKFQAPEEAQFDNLPNGYILSNSILSYNIEMSQNLLSIIEFTVPANITEDIFNVIRIFHEYNGEYEDATILSGIYAPNYSTKKVYAQVSQFSPFYLIPYIEQATTTILETTTLLEEVLPIENTTTTTCQPNSISYIVDESNEYTNTISFIGSPSGPFSVKFTSIYGITYNLTTLLGTPISLNWIFDRTSPEYIGIPTVFGLYEFTLSSGCVYEVEVILNVPTTIPITTTTTTQLVTTTITPSTTIEPTTTSTTISEPTTIAPTTANYFEPIRVSVNIQKESVINFSISGSGIKYFAIKKNESVILTGSIPCSENIILKESCALKLIIDREYNYYYYYDYSDQTITEISIIDYEIYLNSKTTDDGRVFEETTTTCVPIEISYTITDTLSITLLNTQVDSLDLIDPTDNLVDTSNYSIVLTELGSTISVTCNNPSEYYGLWKILIGTCYYEIEVVK